MNQQSTAHHIGLLLLRVAFAGLLLSHGVPKLLGFSEMSGSFPDPLGIGSQLSLMSAIGAEVGCSLLVIAGLLTRLAALPLIFTMAVAFFIVHSADPFSTKELALAYLAAFVVIALLGPGRFSLDHLIRNRKADRGQNEQTRLSTL